MPKRDGISQKNLKEQALASGVDPASVQLWGDQAYGLQRSYGDSKGLLKLQRQQLKQQFQHQKGSIYQQRVFDMQSAAGAAAERGVLGSSADVSARSQVRAGAASQVIAARDAKRSGLSANMSQQIGLNTDYRSGLIQLKQQIAAQTAGALGSAELNEFLNGLADQGSNVSGPNGTRGSGNNNNNNGNGGTSAGGLYGTDNTRLRDFSKVDIRALANSQQSRYSARADEVLRDRLSARRESLSATERIVWKNGRYVKQQATAGGHPGTSQWQTQKALKSLSKLRRLQKYAEAQSVPGQAQRAQ